MELFDFTKIESSITKGFALNVSHKEALQLIESLASQLSALDYNNNRLESKIKWTDGKNEKYDLYFSIFVSL